MKYYLTITPMLQGLTGAFTELAPVLYEIDETSIGCPPARAPVTVTSAMSQSQLSMPTARPYPDCVGIAFRCSVATEATPRPTPIAPVTESASTSPTERAR